MSDISELLRGALDQNQLDDQRFGEIRRAIFNDGKVTTEEADLIFAVNDRIDAKPEDWNEFFIGALTDFLIRQMPPIGYVEPIYATWLMERIEQDNRLSRETELELVLNILRLAKDAPENLELYALEKVKTTIVARAVTGSLAITENDVSNLRRIFYASGGHGGFSVSETEARFLFDLDEISKTQNNHESWPKLFVGAIANYLMALKAPEPADIDAARAADDYLLSNKTFGWNLRKSFQAWRSEAQTSSFLDEAAIAHAETISANEAKWLIDHINRDGEISLNEQALLRFIKTECRSIHDMLEPFLRQVA